MKHEFAARKVQVYVISCADAGANEDWLRDVHSATGYSVSFPVIHDGDFEICKKLGMMPPGGAPDDEGRLRDLLRGVYLVDTMKRVRVIMHYPASVGWSSYEILRCFDALFRADAQLATPVNWIARRPRPTLFSPRARATRRRRRAATRSSSPRSRRRTRSATSRAASGPSRSRAARTTSGSPRTRATRRPPRASVAATRAVVDRPPPAGSTATTSPRTARSSSAAAPGRRSTRWASAASWTPRGVWRRSAAAAGPGTSRPSPTRRARR